MAQATTNFPGAARQGARVLNASAAGQSLWSQAWRRLKRNRMAMIGFIVVALYLLVALLAGVLAPHNPLEFFPGKGLLPPFWDTSGSLTGQQPDPQFILGTDQGGRDLLSRLIYGARTSVFVAFVPAVIILLIGTTLGMASGFFGGGTDNLIMRIADILIAFPDQLLFILLTVAFRESAFGALANGLFLLFAALAVVSWGGLARQIRGQTLQLRNREFVEAARSLGMSNFGILFKHILPNTISTIIVWSALAIPTFITTEAALSLIGLGLRSVSSLSVTYFVTSWGQMINEGRSNINAQPWGLLGAALCISVLVISLTFIGNGLRDALDPKIRK